MSWTPRLDPHRPAPFAPPTVDPFRTRKPTCSKCGRRIVFVEMETGKRMPCDPATLAGDGVRTLVVRHQVGDKILGRVIRRADGGYIGLEPHFGTCPCRPRKVRVPDVPTQGDLFDEASR